MGDGSKWRSLADWWPWSARSGREADGGEGLSASERRQRQLDRLLTRGVPTWSEETQSCDDCGRQLLVGERAIILQRGGELLLSCPLCEERLLAQGCARAASGAGAGAAEEERHLLAA